MAAVVLSAATTALPGLLKSLGPFLNNDGYLAVAGFIFLEDFGVPVPGETILIAAAVYAGAGRLNPVLVGLVALAAAVAGDNVGFAIGHLAGRTVVVRYGRHVGLTEVRLAKVERYLDDHGGKIIVVARFVEGLRQANGIVAGLSEMSWLKFLPFNVCGAVLWVSLWLTLGDAAGTHITTIYNDVTRYSLVALGIVLLVVAYRTLRHLHRRQATRSEQEPTLAADTASNDG
jgi:membrane protein DedA with SNARE-associated domain